MELEIPETIPPPVQVIVPSKLFDLDIVPREWKWRDGQKELAQRIVDSPKKIIMLEAECGTGKSIIPIAAARSVGANAIVLIQTINLQEQYMRDFHNAKMMAGRRHSICNKTGRGADRAPCTIGAKCELKGTWDYQTGTPIIWPECDYFSKKAESVVAEVSIQNYAFWLNETKSRGSAFFSRDWIICDEAHELDLLLMAAGILDFSYSDLRDAQIHLPNPTPTVMEDWVAWSRANIGFARRAKVTVQSRLVAMGLKITPDEDFADGDAPDWDGGDLGLVIPEDAAIDTLVGRIHSITRVINAMKDLNALSSSEYDEWVIQPTRESVLLKPIYGKYGFRRILAAARHKVVLMSAFLAPELLCKTLGIDINDVEVIDAGKVFDRTKSQIYYCPTIKLGYKTKPNEWKYVFKIMDRFTNLYMNDKGLIHVPSVKLRDDYLNNTELRHRFLAYDAASTSGSVGMARFPVKDKVITTYVTNPKPHVIVGQSISTGLDLPYQPKWQLIPKLWYMPLDDPAVIKRKEVDKDFYTYYTICQIVQATGRVKRAPDHDGPTIILDAQFGWFYGANKAHFPKWFRDNLVWDGWKVYDGIYRALRALAMQTGVSL